MRRCSCKSRDVASEDVASLDALRLKAESSLEARSSLSPLVSRPGSGRAASRSFFGDWASVRERAVGGGFMVRACVGGVQYMYPKMWRRPTWCWVTLYVATRCSHVEHLTADWGTQYQMCVCLLVKRSAERALRCWCVTCSVRLSYRPRRAR